ncbi:MAG: ABC transporter permease [Clostridia bacterium]|nr:ABC transporter permease [Clostridia bacterium]
MRAFRYFLSRLKGHIKSSPVVILVSLITAAAIAGLGWLIVDHTAKMNDDGSKIFKIGIVGDMNQRFIGLAVNTMNELDEAGLSVEFVPIEEEEAKRGINDGTYVMYLRVPDDFIESAARGEFIPVTLVSEGADVGLVKALVTEFIKVAETLADEAQRSVFGGDRYMYDRGISWRDRDPLSDAWAVRYVEFILKRNETIKVHDIGNDDSFPIGTYYFSAFVIFFAMLFGVACASHLAKKDYSLPKLLLSRRIGAVRQMLCENAAYFIFSFLFLAAIVMLGGAVLSDGRVLQFTGGKTFPDYVLFALSLAPVCLVVSSAQIFIYEIAGGLVPGVLLQFTAAVSTAYISGFFYPSSFFPVTVQKIASVLPGGVAFRYAECFFTGESVARPLAFLLLYAALFIALSAVVRKIKTGGDES